MNYIEMKVLMQPSLGREIERHMHNDGNREDAGYIHGRYLDRGETCPWCLDNTLMAEIGRAIAPAVGDINAQIAEFVRGLDAGSDD